MTRGFPSPRSHRRPRIEIIPLIDINHSARDLFCDGVCSPDDPANRAIPVTLPAAGPRGIPARAAGFPRRSPSPPRAEGCSTTSSRWDAVRNSTPKIKVTPLASSADVRRFSSAVTRKRKIRPGHSEVARSCAPVGHHQDRHRNAAEAGAVSREWIIAGVVALGCHALLLFGFRLETTAVLLPTADTAVDVDLVATASAPAPAAPKASSRRRLRFLNPSRPPSRPRCRRQSSATGMGREACASQRAGSEVRRGPAPSTRGSPR